MLPAGRVVRQFIEFLKTYLLILKYSYFSFFFSVNFLAFYLVEQNLAVFVDARLDYLFEDGMTLDIFFKYFLIFWGGYFRTTAIYCTPLEYIQGTYFLMDHIYELVDNDPKIDWAERIYPLPFKHEYYTTYSHLFEDLTPYRDYLDWEEDLYPAFEFFKSYQLTNFRLKYYRPPYAIMPLRGCEYEDSVFTYFKLKKKRI